MQVHKQRIWEAMISIFSKTVKMQEEQEKKWETESGESLPRWIGCTFLIRMLEKDFLLLEKQTRSSLCENTSDGSKITRNLISSTSCQFSQTLFRQGTLMGFVCGRQMFSLQSLREIIKVPCHMPTCIGTTPKRDNIVLPLFLVLCTRHWKAQESGSKNNRCKVVCAT